MPRAPAGAPASGGRRPARPTGARPTPKNTNLVAFLIAVPAFLLLVGGALLLGPDEPAHEPRATIAPAATPATPALQSTPAEDTPQRHQARPAAVARGASPANAPGAGEPEQPSYAEEQERLKSLSRREKELAERESAWMDQLNKRTGAPKVKAREDAKAAPRD